MSGNIVFKKQFTLMCNGVFPVQHQTLFVDTRTLRHTVSPSQHYVNDKPYPESLLSPNESVAGLVYQHTHNMLTKYFTDLPKFIRGH